MAPVLRAARGAITPCSGAPSTWPVRPASHEEDHVAVSVASRNAVNHSAIRRGDPMDVKGNGGNTAGQAALYLAKAGCAVRLVIRAPNLSASMSSYLADRITTHPLITLRSHTAVAALHGDSSLSGVTLEHRVTGSTDVAAAGLFSFIGAAPGNGVDLRPDRHRRTRLHSHRSRSRFDRPR